jgi:nucleoside-diphosphate-sugar epimerase
MTGDDDAQQRNTVEPTRRLIRAMASGDGEARRPPRAPRLVLVSSLSVYGYEAIPAHTTLDETTPLETDASLRDAYCRGKLAQEALAVAAAQQHGLEVRVMRPGVIYGPGRLWSARLGVAAGPVLLQLGRRARLPLIHVDDCALAIVLGAERPIEYSDLAIGRLEVINVLEDDETTQAAHLARIRRHGRSTNGVPRVVIPLPWGLLSGLSGLLGMLGMLAPRLIARLPAILRPASLHARAKPLRYSNARLRERLGWRRRATADDAMTHCGRPRAGVIDS